MTNKTNFNGWTGKTEFTISDLFKSNLSGTTRSLPNMSSPIIEETVNVVRTPKNGPSRVKVSVPVYKTGETQTQTVTNTRSLSLPQELNSPFTAGTVDYSFPAGGGFSIDGFDGSVYDVKVDSNGKYLVGGDFGKYYYNGNQTYSPYLIRLNSDGTVDDTFSITSNWVCYEGGFNGTVYSVEVQPDGKILVGGSFTQFDRDLNCNTSNRIIRLNSDGSKDLTFSIGDGFNDEVYDIQVQPDGKILVGGYFTQYNNIDSYYIIRLNSNGSIDSSFLIGNSDVSFNDYVNTIKLQSDGKILVGGYFTTYGFNSQNYISRLNTNGTIDPTFQIGNGFDDEVNTIAVQSDGKIIVGGYFRSFDNNNLFNGYIVRLDSNGTLDTLFGYGLDDIVQSLSIQSDGKIIVGGDFTRCYIDNSNRIAVNRLVRFHSDCSFDYSFYYDTLFNATVECITVLEDNNILIGGRFGDDDPAIYPLNYFGRLHNSISVYPYSYTVQACAQPLRDETITYVVGSMIPLDFESVHTFQSINNPSVTVCGYIDYTYPSNIIEYVEVNGYGDCYDAYTSYNKLVLIEDCITGDILDFWAVDNKYEIGDIFYIDQLINAYAPYTLFAKFAAKIVNITPWSEYPGEFIPIWDVLPSSNYAPYSSCKEAIEANGVHYVVVNPQEMEATFPLIHKIYSFDDYDNAKVSLLEPFGNNPVKTLVDYFPTGEYSLISGGTPEIYSTVEFRGEEPFYESSIKGLTAMSPNGTLNGFFENTGFDGSLVYTMAEQSDGKILVGGNFNDYLEVPVGNFMRINPDGSLDETFYLGQFNSYIRAITIQPDGKILVGGDFTNYDGYNAGYIIRLNSDGTIDRNFTYSSEFNDTVRAIAVQRDGKIVVGGDFNYYYDFYCPQIARLNSNGTPDRTFLMGDGFDGNQVFTISIESTINRPYYFTQGPITYTENIIVGGWFTWYNGTNVGGIVKLSPTGDILPDFGGGFNQEEGDRPRVNQILTQPDGKLIVIGGGSGDGYLREYNGTWIPQNIVRLIKNNKTYVIDETFTTRDWDSDGGFNGNALSISLLPNGKYMVGGQFDYYGDNNNYNPVPYLVRLNSNGTLDETFTFDLDDDYVNKTLLLSSGRLLVGGRFNTPYDRLLELFIGEEYKLRSFDTCDGLTSNIFVPTSLEPEYVGGSLINVTEISYAPISTEGLDLVYSGSSDDTNRVIVMPTPFDITFLETNYTSINVSSNPYITFGEGGSPGDCCFEIPNEIPTSTELPGVYLSFACPDEIDDYDAQLYELYSGLTDGGNTMIIKYIGSDHCDEIATLVYGFKFYKDNSEYFDLIIEENTQFFNNDPTGGISNGVDPTWLSTFNSSPNKSYRLSNSTPKAIKANVNDRVSVCGQVGDIITTPQLNGGILGGSMYFDGNLDTMVQVDNAGGQFGFNGLNDFTIEWFQYYEGGGNARPFSIGVYGPLPLNEMIGMSFEGSVYLWVNNGNYNTNIINDDLLNGWHHIAITRYFDGLNHNWRVFLDGVQKLSVDDNTDTSNTYTLTLGNQLDNDGRFQGYITNFRVNNLSALYTSDFIVPTSPLTCDSNIILTMDATNEAGLVTDSCNQQTILSSTGVIWSDKTPFVNTLDFSLFTATNFTSYNSCDDCDQLYQTMLYVRDGSNSNRVQYNTMTKTNIDKVLSLGPIFTIRGPECFEILKYYK